MNNKEATQATLVIARELGDEKHSGTADEVGDIGSLEVVTEHNGGVCSRDFVNHMRHSPYELVRFHSQFMTLYPGDLISTGCPKGARIKVGDHVACRIDRVGRLEARVTA